jgi:4-amino-4-deoxy-L-arabinose transferase-like glycosyltransferase
LNWRRLFLPRLDAPLPLWMVFPVIFAALYATHAALLRLPYYWDEAGYYIPAAWDFFRTGSLIPTTTLNNAHPPLPSIYLALWWKASGFYPEVTREAVLMVASLGLLAVWRLAMRVVGKPSVAFWTTLLTGLYPVWFAQSTLAQADIFAASCSLWGMVYALPERGRRPWMAMVWFSAAALCKETAIVIPLTLVVVSFAEGLRDKLARRTHWSETAWLTGSCMPLLGWYAWHYAKTGSLLGNTAYVEYNAEGTLTPLRIVAAFGHRILHLTANMNMFVPVMMALAALLLAPRSDAEGKERANVGEEPLKRIFALLLANAVFFSVLGGALLTRYLLPMYPLVLLLAATTLYRRVPYWFALAAVAGGAFVAGLFINPPYGIAPEDSLLYARVVRMQQAGIAELGKLDPGAPVLTAWPASDELRRPELGYVKKPWQVCAIDDFSAAQIDLAGAEPGKCQAALVFATKYDPPPLVNVWPFSRGMDKRYFGLHDDLTPSAIARRLGGKVQWRMDDAGMWIAVITLGQPVVTRTVSPERGRD